MLLLLLLLLLLRWHVCSVTVSHRDYSFTTENLIKTFKETVETEESPEGGAVYTRSQTKTEPVVINVTQAKGA